MYYHLWDAMPIPKYNKIYFESTDFVAHINRLSGDIVKSLDSKFENDPWRLKYIPHGIDTNLYNPENKHNDEFKQFSRDYLSEINSRYDFVVGFNSRNIKRKMISDIMYGFKLFVNSLSKKEKSKAVLLIHTDNVVSEHGTDLYKCKQDLLSDANVIFSLNKLSSKFIPYIYNASDVFVNLSSNEGYGLSSAEALMSGVPVISTMTGGLQDQQGLKFENGDEYLTETGWINNVKYTHGDWCKPLKPATRNLVGSPPTPYIFDDRIDIREYVSALRYFYDMGKKERIRVGLNGRNFLIENGHTQFALTENFRSSLKDLEQN